MMLQKIYAKQCTTTEAIQMLQGKVNATNSSLKMNFRIYTCMREAKCYKIGTSETFTKFLLNNIYISEQNPIFMR